MQIAVTGAAGLVGRHVVTALLDRGYDVRAVVRRPGAVTFPDGVPQVRADVTRADQLRAAFDGADAVVHCAAPYAYDLPEKDMSRVAVDGTRQVIDAAAAVGARRVVVTSSSVTCGSSAGPESVDETNEPGSEHAPAYFRVKQAQEETALDLGASIGLEVVIACPTVVLGGPDRRLGPSNAILARYLLDPARSTFPGGCNVVSVADVGMGHVVLLESGTPGTRYLLGGDNLTWRELFALTSELAGVSGPGLEVPMPAVLAVATLAELWARVSGKPALTTRDEAGTVGRHFWYRSRRAADLGYTAADARSTVAGALSWLIASDELPRWLRESLRPTPEVRAARALVARPLAEPVQPRPHRQSRTLVATSRVRPPRG